MPQKQKINLEKVLQSLNTVCPKRGHSITPDRIRRIDAESLSATQKYRSDCKPLKTSEGGEFRQEPEARLYGSFCTDWRQGVNPSLASQHGRRKPLK